MLEATYFAPVLLAGSDVENVLFTNVDPTGGIFDRLALDGVAFEYVHQNIECLAPDTGLTHGSRYQLADIATVPDGLAAGQVLAEFSDVAVGDLLRVTRAPRLWLSLRHAPAVVRLVGRPSASFAIDATLRIPRAVRLHPVAKIKLVMDAVSMAFSAENGESQRQGLEAMAGHAGIDAEEMRDLLCDDSRAVLGRHKLVTRSGQVSPADHACRRGRLRIERSSVSEWALSARVITLS